MHGTVVSPFVFMLLWAGSRQRDFAPLISHLCWENLDYSSSLARMIKDGITNNDYDNLQSFFRAALMLTSIEDEQQVRWRRRPRRLAKRVPRPPRAFVWCNNVCRTADVLWLQEARVAVVMQSVLEAVHSQRMYYLATDRGLDLVTRMAKHSPLVRRWLFDNRASWAWAATWLETNPRPPSAYYSHYGTQV